MTLTSRDRETLRRLAGEYMEAASLPVQREKMLLWKSHNRLDRKRPMLNIDQLPWNELEAADGAALLCTCLLYTSRQRQSSSQSWTYSAPARGLPASRSRARASSAPARSSSSA